MSHEFHDLKVSKVVQETPKSSSVYFEIPTELKEKYNYQAGQYLTLKFDINGAEERRAYSICTSPLEGELGVNVKRVDKGLISNHINDNIKRGDVLAVMQPDGNFVIDIAEHKQRDFYFFASGSGITPIISMIKTIVEQEPKSICYLLYGNTNEDHIIFKAELDELARKYAGQFVLKHTLSKPKREKAGGLKGLFSKGKMSWTGATGRIDGKRVDQFLEDNPAKSVESHYFVCGPGAMIDTIINHLELKGIQSDFLHTERFVIASGGVSMAGVGVESTVTAHFGGKTVTVQVPPRKTILDTLLDENHDAPYSCTSGACSTCVAKVIKGDVTMDVCYALDDSEVKAGYVLTCQARAQSPEVEISFES